MENQATSNNITSIAARKQTVCVADLDSILHRGYDKKSRRANPRGILKIREFASALTDCNVVKGTLCQNWSFGPIAEAIWKTCGLTCSQGCDRRQGRCRRVVAASGGGKRSAAMIAARSVGPSHIDLFIPVAVLRCLQPSTWGASR